MGTSSHRPPLRHAPDRPLLRPVYATGSALALYDRRARAEFALCDAIEEAANGLPTFCLGRFLRIAEALRTVGRKRTVAGLIAQLDSGYIGGQAHAVLAAALILIEAEEESDADVAMELADALEIAATEGRIASPDALGYLMRSYFSSRRRHLAWRREAFVERARAMLDAGAFERLMRPLATPFPDIRVITSVRP